MWDFPLQSDRIKSICSTYWNPHSVVTFDSPCRKQLPGRWSWVQLVDLVKVVACYEDIPIVHFHFYCNLTFLLMSTGFLLLLTVFFTFCRFNCSQLWSYRLLWTFCRLYVCLWLFPHHRFAALFRFVCLLAEKALLPLPSSRSTHARCSPTPSQQRASSRLPAPRSVLLNSSCKHDPLRNSLNATCTFALDRSVGCSLESTHSTVHVRVCSDAITRLSQLSCQKLLARTSSRKSSAGKCASRRRDRCQQTYRLLLAKASRQFHSFSVR